MLSDEEHPSGPPPHDWGRAEGEGEINRLQFSYAIASKGPRRVDKQKKTGAELEEIVKQRIGAGDFKVTVHRNTDTGWHAMIHGRQSSEVHRCQVMADTIAVELCQHYDLAE
jgi:hypothetical protein